MAIRPDIRLARPADAGYIARLARDLVETGLGWTWTPSRVERHIRSPDASVITAVDGLRLLGFAIMHFGEEHAHLNLLAVRPRYRRAGIGTSLIRWLEASAGTAGIVRIGLEVRAGNLGARRFYERLGFEDQQWVPCYYGGREAAVRMVRILRAGEALNRMLRRGDLLDPLSGIAGRD